ncbi:envelope stress response membrane protein PspC [Psychrobium sp. 1_MG-2023]|uniref:envelope stress response membrane protein PspC n=1 Tax=Psychrobium sp. 1_MG-2023 TaxID=3062624 RepID=UPI002734CB6E|nr:envelope stress response membrane protein PspC [Psychrobium sp. 1_MG-2023]MDP2562424.1 envelope stress response membrane protein PspC [Psychrobium sp. 1_MG-2023]
MSKIERSNELYRISEQAKIGGVCAGLAERFGVETWLVRVGVASAFFLGGSGFIFLMYIAAWFMLDDKPAEGVDEHGGLDHKVSIKSKVWQPGQPPKEAFRDVKTQFRQLELRLRNVERYVTSSEFHLSQEIDKL